MNEVVDIDTWIASMPVEMEAFREAMERLSLPDWPKLRTKADWARQYHYYCTYVNAQSDGLSGFKTAPEMALIFTLVDAVRSNDPGSVVLAIRSAVQFVEAMEA